MKGRGSVAISRSAVMRFARGLYDTGKNRVTSRTIPWTFPVGSTFKVVAVDGKTVASGMTWPLCYANLRANCEDQS